MLSEIYPTLRSVLNVVRDIYNPQVSPQCCQRYIQPSGQSSMLLEIYPTLRSVLNVVRDIYPTLRSVLNVVRDISNPQDGMKMCMFMQNVLTRLLRLPLLSVALVEGSALGGGAELTTACDFRLMVPGGMIRFVHKHMGLVPGWGGAARLVRIVGSQNALKMLGGALKVDPEMGLQIGLADGVLEGSLDGSGANALLEAEQWLGCYTTGPASVIRAIKKVVVSGRELPLEVALRTERDVFGTVWGGPANLQALASKAKHK
ncbi:ethylmalonyl-CoA decarboxylase isoform X3 [Salmo salar]|uniref:Ethylmalonyl-CoA decarboxylase n=1 Tax=Salmo salar TaxID=8030 RepID=A0ABM3E903_SALSA|nr:ethylmalonyl-CoA decarboxylase-like isoform X3 [Salmo salar]